MKKLRLIALLLALVLCFQSVPAYAAQMGQEMPEAAEEIPEILPEETYEEVEEEPELLTLTETVSGYCGGEGDGTNLTWILIPDGTLTISGTGSMVNSIMPPWYDYSQLVKKVVINNSVTTIGECAFYGHINITTVAIPDTLANIGRQAFDGCDSLQTVTLPASVTNIGHSAFRGCDSLTEISVASTNTAYTSKDGVLFNKRMTTLIQYPIGSSRISYTIPNTVTNIDNSAFAECDNLTSVTIPNSLKAINYDAFRDCVGLTSVSLPEALVFLGKSVFSGCDGLTEILVADANTAFTSKNGVLFSKDGTELISYPAGGDADYSIPTSVTTIRNTAFSGCENLTSVIIPTSVTIIGSEVFEGCTSLRTVEIPGSVKTIGFSAFHGCTGLSSVVLPDKLTAISSSVFAECANLTSVEIPDSVTTIGTYAFARCSGLTSVVIGTSVATIDGWAFAYCVGLPFVEIPNSVTTIDNSAFAYCTGLRSVVIPNSVTTIGASAFTNCDGLISVSIGDAVTTIGDWAFYSCNNLTSVIMGNSVTTIGKSAFIFCTNLTSIDIPMSVTTIGDFAFQMCNSLTAVVVPDSVTTIGSHAFSLCEGLKTLMVGSAVVSVGDYAFDSKNLTKVYFKCNAPKYASWTFGSDVTYYYIPGTTGWTDSSAYNAKKGTWNGKKLSAWSGVVGAMPVQSNDEKEVLNAALENYDFSNLMPNITTGMSKLRGPSITIADKTFYLFEIDSKVEIPLNSKLSIHVNVDNDKKTVNLLVGYTGIKGGTTIVGDSNSLQPEDTDFWKSYTDAKELYKLATGKTANSAAFRSKFQNTYDKMQEFNMDMIVNATGKVSFFVEGSYETGKLEFSEAGGILAVNLNKTINSRIPSFPAAYVTLKLDASAEGQLKVVADKAMPSGMYVDVPFDAALGAAIGVGLGKNTGEFQLYIEGGFDGELGAHIRPRGTVPFSVDMTGNLYIEWKAKAWIFEVGDPYKKELFKLGLYPKLELLDALGPEKLTMEDFYAEAQPVTREYLQVVSPLSITDNYSFMRTEYPYAEPSITHLDDGRVLMVWVGDNGIKANEDRTSIHYSIYSGGIWSEPAIIHESGTYNDHPVICADEGRVYALWMRADQSLVGAQTENALKRMDLVCSEFDGSSWSVPQVVSKPDNGMMEMEYALTAEDGSIYAAWVENSENDLVGGSGTSKLHLRTCTNGIWGQDCVIYTAEDPIIETSATAENELQVTFSVVSNDTAQTYLYNDGSVTSITGSDKGCKWIDGNLYELRGMELYCNGEPMGLEGVTNFEIVTSGDRMAALTLVSDGFGCELYGSYYDKGTETWGKWVKLTSFGKYIRSYSALLDESGKIIAAMNLVNVDTDAERIYDNNSAMLVVVDDCRYSDLAVEQWLAYDETLVAPAATVPITFQVTNNSAETLTKIKATVNGTSREIACMLAAGDTGEFTTPYVLPQKLQAHTVTLTVASEQIQDADSSNNSVSVDVAAADLVTAVSEPVLCAGGAEISVDVSNEGYADAKNVVLTAYRGRGGEVLYTKTLGMVEVGERLQCTVPLPKDMLYLNDWQTMYAVNVEVGSDTKEWALANNEDRTVFGNLLPLQVRAEGKNGTIQVDVKAETGEGVAMLALYNTDGKMFTVQEAGLQTQAQFKIDRTKYPGEICAKVFWLKGSSFNPAVVAWEKSFEAVNK